jgi:hypothetical protein
MMASVAIAVGLISWEVGTGAIPALIASFIGVEVAIRKSNEKTTAKE